MKWETAALFVTTALAVLGGAAWLNFASWLGGSADTAVEFGVDDARGDAASPGMTRPPSLDPGWPVSPLAVASPAPKPSTVVNGLHVLCNGRHLLLTADFYYRAETVEDEKRLTELLGPPVANVYPHQLPPRSSTSVTDALEQLTS